MDLEKVVFALIEIYKTDYSKKPQLEIVSFSKFEITNKIVTLLGRDFYHKVLTLHVKLEVFSKHYGIMEVLESIISRDFKALTTYKIDEIKILPDYDKFNVVNSHIQPIYTEWDEINQLQLSLINQLKSSNTSVEFQNIGNTSRTIMQKLSKVVFDKSKHTPTDISVKLDSSSFKNQLHSFIKIELAGAENEKLRKFGEAAIESVERSIDLANSLTHKLEAERNVAELCVIGTLSSISIVKMIDNK